MKTKYTVLKAPGMNVWAVEVPGGLLMITDVYEDGEGVAVASSFVPMTHEDRREFLMDLSAGSAS
jgi:hypothetical protein